VSEATELQWDLWLDFGLLITTFTYKAIRNDNLVTLKTVLSVGFIPIGCIMKENKLYIQVQRGPKDG
jgi:hypothetical protein